MTLFEPSELTDCQEVADIITKKYGFPLRGIDETDTCFILRFNCEDKSINLEDLEEIERLNRFKLLDILIISEVEVTLEVTIRFMMFGSHTSKLFVEFRSLWNPYDREQKLIIDNKGQETFHLCDKPLHIVSKEHYEVAKRCSDVSRFLCLGHPLPSGFNVFKDKDFYEIVVVFSGSCINYKTWKLIKSACGFFFDSSTITLTKGSIKVLTIISFGKEIDLYSMKTLITTSDFLVKSEKTEQRGEQTTVSKRIKVEYPL